jgi:hypothetical protein
MNPLVYVYALAYWLVLMVIGIVNGILRGLALSPRMTELRAHQLSSLTGIIFFSIASFLFVFLVRLNVVLLDLVVVGVLWLSLTIAFEFIFGHYIMKHPWQQLLADYDLRKGRLWSFVLLTILFVPSLMGFLLGIPA